VTFTVALERVQEQHSILIYSSPPNDRITRIMPTITSTSKNPVVEGTGDFAGITAPRVNKACRCPLTMVGFPKSPANAVPNPFSKLESFDVPLHATARTIALPPCEAIAEPAPLPATTGQKD
jgi:hypothetical protein